jgi:ABC-type sugar transport system ATPase subunit
MAGLEFRDLHKSFGAVRALRGVGFTVREGETHACVGENGAGKSTLLKILAGLVHPDQGSIVWQGETLRVGSPRDALNAGIGMVYQERLFFPNLSVAANIFAGREIVGRFGRLDDAAMHVRAAALLAQLSVPIAPGIRMEHLSPAYVQLVQVARALAFECRVLVLDEPTTALTDAEASHLYAVLDTLKARGVTILFVSHRLPEVFRLCERITVLRDGQYVGTYDRDTATMHDIVSAMVGREPPERVPRERPTTGARPALAVRGLTRRPMVHDVSFEIAPGEIVGIFGLVGSGRTELLEAIFGLARRDGGTVDVDGVAVRGITPREAVRAGLALVPEGRQQQGLFYNLSLRENLMLPRVCATGRVYVRRTEEEAAAGADVSALSIKTPSLAATPDRLSGGNQQKVVIAKWLGTRPRVLLLDEPTKGVDVGAKFEIHNIIRREAVKGMACLLVSSDLPEVLALADRILVMRDGHLQGEIQGADADEQTVMRLAASKATA